MSCADCLHWRRGWRTSARPAAVDAGGKVLREAILAEWKTTYTNQTALVDFGTCYGVPPVAPRTDDSSPFPTTNENDRCPLFARRD